MIVEVVKLELVFLGNPLTVRVTVPENEPTAPMLTE